MTGRNRPIYLDYQATTPADPRAVDAMLPFFTETFGNAHSEHAHGREAEAAVERAREQVAALIGAEAREIVFTSGATEANNMAVKGVARHNLRHFGKAHIVTCATEHKCVLESARAMEAEGARVTVLPVGPDGLLTVEAVEAALEDETVLVSVMAANNEIGVLQPVAEIGALCRERGIKFHTDAAQAAGKIPLDVDAMKIDLLSLSGHKMYGPKGVGALYIRRRPRARLEPLFSGGGQERGARSGTLPVPLCVGMGEAAAIAAEEMDREAPRMGLLRDRLLERVRDAVPDVAVNGAMAPRLPGNLNLSFPGLDGTALLDGLSEEISVSSGSACMANDVEPSYVLRALGLPDDLAAASIRLCVGRMTTVEEIDAAAAHIAATVARLRGKPAAAAQ